MDGLAPEILLYNAHDQTSAFNLMVGFFRLICENGLICGTKTGDLSIRHQGSDKLLDDILRGTEKLVDRIPQLTALLKLG